MRITAKANQNDGHISKYGRTKGTMTYDMVDLIAEGSVWGVVCIDFFSPGKDTDPLGIYDKLRRGGSVELELTVPEAQP